MTPPPCRRYRLVLGAAATMALLSIFLADTILMGDEALPDAQEADERTVVIAVRGDLPVIPQAEDVSEMSVEIYSSTTKPLLREFSIAPADRPEVLDWFRDPTPESHVDLSEEPYGAIRVRTKSGRVSWIEWYHSYLGKLSFSMGGMRFNRERDSRPNNDALLDHELWSILNETWWKSQQEPP